MFGGAHWSKNCQIARFVRFYQGDLGLGWFRLQFAAR